ncbi:MAG: hypothetical protein AB9903_20530 [Vulcanimicrobiota bacterium]
MSQTKQYINQMLQDALNFDTNFVQEEYSPFTAGFRETVDSLSRDLGYSGRDDMVRALRSQNSDEGLRQAEALNRRLKERSEKTMQKVVEFYYQDSRKEQSPRQIIRLLLQKIRKNIINAESECSRTVAEILYNCVALAALKA